MTDDSRGTVEITDVIEEMHLALLRSGLRIEDVAIRCRVSRQTVSSWLRRHTMPSAAHVMMFARVTGANEDAMLTVYDETREMQKGQRPKTVPLEIWRARRDSNSQPSEPSSDRSQPTLPTDTDNVA